MEFITPDKLNLHIIKTVPSQPTFYFSSCHPLYRNDISALSVKALNECCVCHRPESRHGILSPEPTSDRLPPRVLSSTLPPLSPATPLSRYSVIQMIPHPSKQMSPHSSEQRSPHSKQMSPHSSRQMSPSSEQKSSSPEVSSLSPPVSHYSTLFLHNQYDAAHSYTSPLQVQARNSLRRSRF